MPTAIDKLDENSSTGAIKAAISDCIATEVRNGKPQDQAVAMCHEMARKKTGGQPAEGGA